MAIFGITPRDGLGLTLFVAIDRLDEAEAFYRNVLGATSPRRWADPRTGNVVGVDLTIGSATFTVGAANPNRDADASLAGPCTASAPGRVSTIFQLCVEDVDETVALAERQGAIVRTPVQDADWGDRVATIIDPFGHIWALTTIGEEMSIDEFNARGNIQLVEVAA